MNHDQFVYWLQGFVEMNGGKEPTKAQWKMIKDHLQLCFVKGGTMTPQGQYRHHENMQQWLTPFIGKGIMGEPYASSGAGVPMNKYGKALTNAEIALMQGKGGGGGC